MEKPRYFPVKKPSDIAPWMENFTVTLKPVYKNYDITDAEMAELERDNAFIQYDTGRISAYDEATNLFIKSRNTAWKGDPDNKNLEFVKLEKQVPVIDVKDLPAPVRPNIRARVLSLVLRLRNHPKMDETMAKALAILPNPKSSEDTKTYVPPLTGSVVDGKVVLDCPIKGFAGYEVWRDLSGKNEYTKFGISVGRYFTDDTPIAEGVQAEVRSYKVRMLDTANKPIGEFSAVVNVTVTRAI